MKQIKKCVSRLVLALQNYIYFSLTQQLNEIIEQNIKLESQSKRVHARLENLQVNLTNVSYFFKTVFFGKHF